MSLESIGINLYQSVPDGGGPMSGKEIESARQGLCECHQCGYKWFTRLLTVKPKVCPKCKRYNWEDAKK
jgi:Zn finger protein HypA/HybF involved in hydrogenase expression